MVGMKKWKKVRANKYCLYLNNNLDVNLYLGDNVHTLRISTYLDCENHKQDLITLAIEKQDNINDVLIKAQESTIQVIRDKLKKYKSAVEECEQLVDKLREVNL